MCATNQGEVFVYSLPQLRRQVMRGAEAVLRKEDAVGIASLLLGPQPLALYQSSPSEFALVAFSQSRADRMPNGLCVVTPPGIAPETRLSKTAVKKEATPPPAAATTTTTTTAVKSEAPPATAATPPPASASVPAAAAASGAPAAAPAAAAGAEQAAPAPAAAAVAATPPATPPPAAAPTGNGQPQGGSPVPSTPPALAVVANNNNGSALPPQQQQADVNANGGEGSPQATTRLPTDPSLDNITDHAAPATAPV